jgi:hypothetical protein
LPDHVPLCKGILHSSSCLCIGILLLDLQTLPRLFYGTIYPSNLCSFLVYISWCTYTSRETVCSLLKEFRWSSLVCGLTLLGWKEFHRNLDDSKSDSETVCSLLKWRVASG